MDCLSSGDLISYSILILFELSALFWAALKESSAAGWVDVVPFHFSWTHKTTHSLLVHLKSRVLTCLCSIYGRVSATQESSLKLSLQNECNDRFGEIGSIQCAFSCKWFRRHVIN